VSSVVKTLQSLEGLLQAIYESPSLAHSRALPMIDAELPGLRRAIADAQSLSKQAEAARATARVAIGHLQAILRPPATAAEQQRADTAARDWLASIGADE
jgi:hypothetical protein